MIEAQALQCLGFDAPELRAAFGRFGGHVLLPPRLAREFALHVSARHELVRRVSGR